MNFEHIAKVQGFVRIEYPNRSRIFNESHQLMLSTNNFEVLQRRANIVLDYIHWCYDQRDAGMPLKLNMDRAAAVDDFNKTYNNQAVRIAKYLTGSVTTSRKATKVIPILQNICDSLLMAENYTQSKAEVYRYISVMRTQETIK